MRLMRIVSWFLVGLALAILVFPAVFGLEKPLQQSGSLEPKWARVNWEAEAKDVDVVVIHHTAGKPGMTWEALSKIERSRLYDPRFRSTETDPDLRGLSVQSGHFRIVSGRKVEHFCPYHWIVRADGTAERLLWDDERGWHAGNWDVNCRSIGIAFDGDFSAAEPPKPMLQTCARLLRAYATNTRGIVPTLIAHKEVPKPSNPDEKVATECPGTWWGKGESTLLQMVLDAEPYPIRVSAP